MDKMMVARTQKETQTLPTRKILRQRCDSCRRRPLLQRATNSTILENMPTAVNTELRSPGQPLDVEMRALMEPRFGHDFSKVRVHTDDKASASAKSINARAYTLGNQIVFGSGEYAPATIAGQRLIAHELVHTIQQHNSWQSKDDAQITDPTDNLEREAEIAASTVMEGLPINIAVSAPPVLARRGAGPTTKGTASSQAAFQGEDPAMQSRRLAAIREIRRTVERLTTALSRGYIWSFERVTPGGITQSHMEGEEETMARRNARLRKLITDLLMTVTRLESAPIPTEWLDPTPEYPGSGEHIIDSEGNQPLTDTQVFYTHNILAQGRNPELPWHNVFYIWYEPIPTPAVSRVPIREGVATGINIVVPNPENEPLVYHRLTQYEGFRGSGVIVDVMQDRFGYYYNYRSQKHYLPRRP